MIILKHDDNCYSYFYDNDVFSFSLWCYVGNHATNLPLLFILIPPLINNWRCECWNILSIRHGLRSVSHSNLNVIVRKENRTACHNDDMKWLLLAVVVVSDGDGDGEVIMADVKYCKMLIWIYFYIMIEIIVLVYFWWGRDYNGWWKL